MPFLKPTKEAGGYLKVLKDEGGSSKPTKSARKCMAVWWSFSSFLTLGHFGGLGGMIVLLGTVYYLILATGCCAT